MVTRKGGENTAASEEVEKQGIDWSQITDLQTARELLTEHYGVILNSTEIFGDGAEFIKNKDLMIGVPFIVLDFRFIVDEKTKREYVTVLVMNGQGGKARFNDGSTGIYAQLKKIHEQYGVQPIACKFGLRKSDYEVQNDDGTITPATTYYLA